jgi:hypothetical protein
MDVLQAVYKVGLRIMILLSMYYSSPRIKQITSYEVLKYEVVLLKYFYSNHFVGSNNNLSDENTGFS